jgi:hypothetical protein
MISNVRRNRSAWSVDLQLGNGITGQCIESSQDYNLCFCTFVSERMPQDHRTCLQDQYPVGRTHIYPG